MWIVKISFTRPYENLRGIPCLEVRYRSCLCLQSAIGRSYLTPFYTPRLIRARHESRQYTKSTSFFVMCLICSMSGFISTPVSLLSLIRSPEKRACLRCKGIYFGPFQIWAERSVSTGVPYLQ